VVLAAPVGPSDVHERFAGDADEVAVTETPDWFHTVGQVYIDFRPTSDDEVVDLLERAADRDRSVDRVEGGAGVEAMHGDEGVLVPAGGVTLEGRLIRPDADSPVVVFAHGSGSSRHSPRNRMVATRLRTAGLGTLLFDLLTPAEEPDRTNVFDIELLAGRLTDVTAWLRGRLGSHGPAIGYFGASTGAAAALWAAAEPGAEVAAVVSRGGRPDLAGPRLGAVAAPTLLIVGDRDTSVLACNRDAQAGLRCESELALVAGATHLFEEPGTLQQVAELAQSWFSRHLAPVGPDPA
jgi:putative phosphoribosyl transferase